MRKNLLMIGLVLLVLGVAIAGVSTYEVSGGAIRSLSGAGNTMHLGSNGDFYSNTLNVSSGYEVLVVSSVQTYLIPLQDLNSVNAVNVNSFAINPTTPLSGSTSTTYFYGGLNGSYVLVTFGSASPSTMDYAVIKSGNIGQIVTFGLLLLVGVVLVIAGIIIAIVGAILKPKYRSFNQY